MNCPKCDAELEFEPADPSVGIECGGWYCDACDLFTSEYEVERELLDGDVGIPPIEPERKIGTPISTLSGRPGHPGFEQFKKIAKSWGYD